VYLDHWALRELSDAPPLRARLVGGLKRSGGSLALSWANVGEFTRVADDAQRRVAEDIVEQLLPDVYFLEVDPFKVIDREDALLTGGSRAAPHHDTDLLKVFASLNRRPAQQLTARGLFPAVRGRILPGLTHVGEALIDRVSRCCATRSAATRSSGRT
jgi:hypothetical protein